MSDKKFLLPKVVKMITMLISTLSKNNSKLVSDRNKRNMELLAAKLPSINLQKGTTSFNAILVANKIMKSKKKLMKKTKSKYTFIPITKVSIKKRND